MGEQPTQQKNNVWAPLFFALVMIGGMAIGLKMKGSSTIFEKIEDEELVSHHNMEAPLLQVVRYIDSKYVDSLNQSEFAEKAIKNIIRDLDPHSVYLPPKTYMHSKEQLNGSFVGIGIEFLMINDTLTIGQVIDNGPAEQGGLHSGDQLIKLDDSLVAGVHMKARDIVSLIKGDRGTPVNLTCLRADGGEKFIAKIIRDDIDLPSIPAAFMLDDHVGYVKISSFTATTSREFAQSVMHMIDDEGMADLILDLRDNPGGYLDEAVGVLNHIFLDKHKLLVYTSGSKVGKKDYETNGASRLNIKKIAVLVNEESASAAEITAGALQDWDRAVIVGRRSFGKGLVQEEMTLANGGAIRLTVARYYTPSGRCIQKDYSNRERYDHDIENRFKNGELYHSQDVKTVDTTNYYTANGRLVHGGGGITPEVFIPMDSALVAHHWLVLNSYAQEFLLSQPKLLADNFQVSGAVIDSFVAFAKKKNDLLVDKDFGYYRPLIRRNLVAYVRKYHDGSSAYYEELIREKDPFIKAALKQLRKKNVFDIQ